MDLELARDLCAAFERPYPEWTTPDLALVRLAKYHSGGEAFGALAALSRLRYITVLISLSSGEVNLSADPHWHRVATNVLAEYKPAPDGRNLNTGEGIIT